MASVTFEHATRIYPGAVRPAVDSIDLQIADGELMVLLGPPGCGKSTLLRMLAGLEELDGGRIWIGDLDVTDVAAADRDIAMAFESYALYPHMTVGENMGFALKVLGVPKAERVARIEEAARLLDLEPVLAKKPVAISGSQRQRVAMGRAIVRRPQVFLMDEPLANLDEELRAQTRSQIQQLQRKVGVTTLYVTVDPAEAFEVADRAAEGPGERVRRAAARRRGLTGPARVGRGPGPRAPRRGYAVVMPGSLRITATTVDPELLELPWDLPLERWPEERIAALPKGISRHIVRLAHLTDHVVAIKETTNALAVREYEMLRTLQRLQAPCVEPVAVIANRRDAAGEELDTALVTRHLRFSMPYRAVFSQRLRPGTATRLVDALAVLLVRLHLAGFFWGDVSLSNTLFRRDAGAFAAYLVDAETGELFEGGLSAGQREHDLEIARINIAGELLDLQADDRLEEDIDPVAVSERIVQKYRELWQELTGTEQFDQSERWRINLRVERLNELGFDIEEFEIRTDDTGTTVRLQPKVVDAGHHSRRLLRLTGLDTEENQARRLLNDLDAYRARLAADADEEVAAHEWLTKVFEPVIRAIPRDLRSKFEAAEIFHQLLDHRWYRAENEARDVPLSEALTSYIDTVLRHRRDEITIVGPATDSLDLGAVEQTDTGSSVDWRDLV